MESGLRKSIASGGFLRWQPEGKFWWHSQNGYAIIYADTIQSLPEREQDHESKTTFHYPHGGRTGSRHPGRPFGPTHPHPGDPGHHDRFTPHSARTVSPGWASNAIRTFGAWRRSIFGLVLVWTLLQLGLFMPILNHLTGTTQDLSDFADMKGNTGKLLTLLAFTWTLAAFGEEIAYRGYLQRRLCDLFGEGRLGIGIAVGLSSILFGLAHTEQGLIGVVITTLDALFFSWLKFRFHNNLWAAILAHGFSNTVGLVGFYFVGPIYGLW